MAATQTSFPVVVDEKTVHLDEVKEPIAAHQADCVEDAGKPAAPVLDYAGAARKTNPAEIKLVRKLDFIILPTLWLMYWLNFLDRNAITVARLDGLEKELKLTSGQYQTCISILFVGYILGQVPANMVITRVRPSLFMATFMALWAVVSTLTGIVHNYTGMVLARFFLGILEAPFWPGALYMLSIFYTRKEVATRMAILFSANICGTAFAGFIAIGIFEMSGKAGLAGWRWMFIIQGIVTFGVAVVAAFFLPDEPLTTRWLTPEERQLAHDRMAVDTVERRDNTTTWKGLLDACKDLKMWLFVLTGQVNMAAANFKNFFPTILNTLGYSRNVTLALMCPPYIVAGAITIAFAWNSGRMNERTWHTTVAKIIAIIGFVIACSTLNTGARYFSTFVFCTGIYAVQGLGTGWLASTCGQTREKKAISLAIFNTFVTVAPIYTPYLWPQSDGPRYAIAMGTSAGLSVVAIGLAWLMKWLLIRENRKIRQSDSEAKLFYAY